MTKGWWLAGLLAAAACGPDSARTIDGLHGFLPPAATPRPAFTLSTLSGEPFAFDQATAGTLTFLFFGYTNCPDVCPATMATLSAVLGRLTAEDRRNIRVVFVTTDPERDTPDRLAEWLGHFDRSFIGLTGTPDQIKAAERAARVAPAFRDTTLPSGDYFVAHAAQVIVVSPDDSVHIRYPASTMQRDWADDLPGLRRLWSKPRGRS